MKKRINPLVFDLSIDSKIVDKFTIARKEVERTIQSNRMDWNEKNLIKEVERLKAKINNKTAYTKSIEKKAYNLSVENEFLKNRIAIIESKKGFEITKIKSLTKEEQIELLEKVRAFKASAVSFIDNSKNNKKEEKKEVELVRGNIYKIKDSVGSLFRYKVKGSCNSKLCFSHTNHTRFMSGGYIGYAVEFTNATEDEKQTLIKQEEENGGFWNDEKQDFLKLEDVCYKAKTRQELLDIASIAGVEFLSNDFDIRISYPFVQMIDSSFICNSLIAGKGKIEVTKEVFIKLLKNYKG